MRATSTARRPLPLTAFLLIVALAVAMLVPAAPAAHADAGLESEFVAAVNRERAAHGLPALAVSGDLASTARSHSTRMADASSLHHNPNLGSHVSGWQKVGENVGRGPSVSAIHAALMASPGHRANILGSDFAQLGVGVEVRDGTVWVTQVFRLPAEAANTKPEPKPETESTTSASTPEASSVDTGGSRPSTGPASTGRSTSEAGASPGSTGSGSAASPTPSADRTSAEFRHEAADRGPGADRVAVVLARLDADETVSSRG